MQVDFDIILYILVIFLWNRNFSFFFLLRFYILHLESLMRLFRFNSIFYEAKLY